MRVTVPSPVLGMNSESELTGVRASVSQPSGVSAVPEVVSPSKGASPSPHTLPTQDGSHPPHGLPTPSSTRPSQSWSYPSQTSATGATEPRHAPQNPLVHTAVPARQSPTPSVPGSPR